MNLWKLIRPFLSHFVRFTHISYLEAKSNYQGTYLGLFWVPLSTLIFTTMLAFVFRHVESGSHMNFFLYVLTGYVLWGLISDSISGSTDIIQKRFEFALHNNLTIAGLFEKILIDRLFIYFVNITSVIIIIFLISPEKFGWNIILFFPFIIIVALTSISVSYLVNLTTIFFPDMSGLIKTGIRFMFFASPVFWIVGDGANHVRRFLAQYNPVAYYLSLSRQVFGIEPLNGYNWLIATGISVATCVAALVAYRWSVGFIRNIK